MARWKANVATAGGPDIVAAAVTALALLALPAGAAAHEAHREGHSAGIASTDASADVTVFDTRLVDQDGQPRRLRSEIVADKVVVVEFFYTTCTTICPVTTTLLAQARAKMADSLVDDVRFVSITVDPTTDTPARLKAYAARHGTPPDWLWLTGDKAAIDKVLDGLGAYTADFADHPSMVLVGDGRRDTWTRYYNFPRPAQILDRVKALLAARKASLAPTSTQD